MNSIDLAAAKEYPQYCRLSRTSAEPSHESAEEWYDSYGAHIETAKAGSVMIQTIEYGWLDCGDDEEILESHRGDLPDGITDGEALNLINLARDVRDAADEIESLLLDAIEASGRGDKSAVIEALSEAQSLERDHGDDPATSHLADQLLELV